jgi:hypothetical protein
MRLLRRSAVPLVAVPLLAAALLAAGCSRRSAPPEAPPPPPPPPGSVRIEIAPTSAAAATGGAVDFQATVTGSADTAVTWTVREPSGGTVAAGRYVAPAAPGTYHVVATAHADAARSAEATVTVTSPAAYLAPSAVAGDVAIAVDTGSTATARAARRPISPLLFGVNNAEFGGAHAADFTIWSSRMPAYTMSRVGGNRATGLDWETGYSNCGQDCGETGADSWRNDTNMVENVFASPGVGNAWAPRIQGELDAGRSIVVTAPILGFVARDASGHQPIPIAPSTTTPATPAAAHWKEVKAHDPAGATATPSTTDGFSYTDDLVKWIDGRWPGRWKGAAHVEVQLDNEPDIWRSTHAEIIGTTNGLPTSGDGSNGVALPFDWYPARVVEHAKAVKDVAPDATVWAGGFAGWDGLTQFHYEAHPGGPPAGSDWYFSYLLDRFKAAETTHGRRLVDVFDVHWYVQELVDWSASVTNDDAPQTDRVVNARLQSTRSLWDPGYIEGSWVNVAIPRALQRDCDADGNCPIALLPNLLASTAAHYPGTKLAIGEYWYGRGGDVSSTLVNADLLGILARHGVYAATMWWNASNIWAYSAPNGCGGDGLCTTNAAYRCALLAVDLWRSYDGAGAAAGDTYVDTAVADASRPADPDRAGQTRERVTAYASVDAADPDRVVVLALNKTLAQSLDAAIRVTHTTRFRRVEVWRVTGTNGGAGGCTRVRQPDLAIPDAATNAFKVTLPAQSAHVLVLRP